MYRLAACLLLAAIVAGCDEKKPKRPGPEGDVGGRLIDRDGEPLAGYNLRFERQATDQAKFAVLVPVRDGKFSFPCLPGRYRVTLIIPKEKADGGPKPQYWELTVPAEGKTNLALQTQ